MTQGCALCDVERYAKLGGNEGLNAGEPRRLDQVQLPGEAGVGDDAHDGVDACAPVGENEAGQHPHKHNSMTRSTPGASISMDTAVDDMVAKPVTCGCHCPV